MIIYLRTESASHVCGCYDCNSCPAIGVHYISVNGEKYFTSFMCRVGQTEPYYLETHETSEAIIAGDTRWILWD